MTTMMRHQIHRAHHHARRAKTALQPVTVFEGGLHGVQASIRSRQTFNGGDGAAIGLHSQHIATFDSSAIDQDGAGPALSRVTSDMGTRQSQGAAQQLDQGGLGCNVLLDNSDRKAHV